jgi:hypothetical protein
MNYSSDDSRRNSNLGKTGQRETQRRDPIAKSPEGLDANHKITVTIHPALFYLQSQHFRCIYLNEYVS